MTTSDVARYAGLSPQQVNSALRSGAISAARQIGSIRIVDDIAAQAWDRSRSRGRRWTPHVRDAALDLLSGESTTHLAGSQLSRLKRTLRSMTVRDISHAAGGLGGTWARYRMLSERSLEGDRIGPAAFPARDLGIIEGGSMMTFLRVDDLDVFESTNAVVPDAYGDVGVVEREADNRQARRLIDTYMLGSERESAAAARLMLEAADAI